MNRPKVGDRAECICGEDIHYAELPEDVPSLRGRRRFWLGRESHLCYPDAEGEDGKALHEPHEGVHSRGTREEGI